MAITPGYGEGTLVKHGPTETEHYLWEFYFKGRTTYWTSNRRTLKVLLSKGKMIDNIF